MSQDNDTALRDAIARNCPAVIALPSAGMDREFKSRFLGEDEAGIWMESSSAQRELIDHLIESGQVVGLIVPTKDGKKLECKVAMQERNEAYRLNDGLVVEAIRLGHPGKLEQKQRRNHFRARWTDDEVTIRIWRIGEKADLQSSPVSAAEIFVKPKDLSAHGVAISCEASLDQGLRLQSDDRLRLMLCVGTTRLIIEGRVRNMQKNEEGPMRLGVEFSKLQQDMQGRQIQKQLEAMVAALQRRELKYRSSGMKRAV